jgi:hypothetical protein
MTSIDETTAGDWIAELQDIGFDHVKADLSMLDDKELSLEANDAVAAAMTSVGKRKATDDNDADADVSSNVRHSRHRQ